MSKLYRIREFSELTSVTIRTLHYYDEIGLLKPSHRTLNHHRVYANEDILRLQQITSLKFLGFSLDEIKKIVLKSGFNPKEFLKTQAKIITEEAERIQHAAKLLQHLVNELELNHSINWDTIVKIIEVLNMSQSQRQSWHEKYLSESELQEFINIGQGRSAEYWQNYSKRWANLFKEVEANLDTDPESEIGLELAKKWLDLANEVYGNNPGLSKKLWEGYKAGATDYDQLPYNQEIINYISKATKKLKEQNGINS